MDHFQKRSNTLSTAGHNKIVSRPTLVYEIPFTHSLVALQVKWRRCAVYLAVVDTADNCCNGVVVVAIVTVLQYTRGAAQVYLVSYHSLNCTYNILCIHHNSVSSIVTSYCV